MNKEQDTIVEVKKKKWYQERSKQLIAALLVVALIGTDVVIRYASASAAAIETNPKALLDDDVYQSMDEEEADRAKELWELLQKSEEIEKKLKDDCDEAQRLIEEGKYKEALDPVNYIIENMNLTTEEMCQLRMLRTALYFYSGDYKKVEDDCTWLIEKGRDENGYYYFMRAACRIQNMEFESSREDLLEALDRGYEEEAFCYVYLTFCEYYLEDYEQVLSYAKEALSREPGDEYKGTLIYFQALANLNLGYFEESASCMTELLDMKEYKENGELYYYRGVSELTLEKYEEAYEDFNLALKYGIPSAEGDGDDENMKTMLYYNRGVAALALNRAEEARSDLQKVVERNNNAELTEASEELLEILNGQGTAR